MLNCIDIYPNYLYQYSSRLILKDFKNMWMSSKYLFTHECKFYIYKNKTNIILFNDLHAVCLSVHLYGVKNVNTMRGVINKLHISVQPKLVSKYILFCLHDQYVCILTAYCFQKHQVNMHIISASMCILNLDWHPGCHLNMISPWILIGSFRNLEHLSLSNMVIRPCVVKIWIFQKFIFVFDKISIFYPKMKCLHKMKNCAFRMKKFHFRVRYAVFI